VKKQLRIIRTEKEGKKKDRGKGLIPDPSGVGGADLQLELVKEKKQKGFPTRSTKNSEGGKDGGSANTSTNPQQGETRGCQKHRKYSQWVYTQQTTKYEEKYNYI